MVSMETREFGQEEWNEIVSGIEALSPMQTWEYGEAKAKAGPWQVSRAVFRKDKRVVAAAQVAIRTVPFLNRGLAWINRGPLLVGDFEREPDVCKKILEVIRTYWVDKKKLYLRVAPPLGVSGDHYSLFENAGYARATHADGWASEAVDLRRSLTDIRLGLDHKWRNCLSKAERLQVHCEIGSTPRLMDELLADYEVLLRRIGRNASLAPEFITALQLLLPVDRKMVVLAARQNGERLGTILVTLYGNKSMYLIGAVNEKGRRMNANHFLIWHAISEMQRRGLKWFDLGGVHPDETPSGILHFKRGVGGTPYQLMGEVEASRNDLLTKIIKTRIGHGG